MLKMQIRKFTNSVIQKFQYSIKLWLFDDRIMFK